MDLFFTFLLGAIVGSFLNVVALRWPKPDEPGKFQIKKFAGRSGCPSCGKKLSWYELIPVFSFVFQKGKCRGCNSKISFQYPLVEILTGLVFVSIFNVVSPVDFLSAVYYLLITAVFCIYIIILIYDFKYKIIPDTLSYSAIVFSFIFVVLNYILQAGSYQLLDFLAGPILFIFFGSIWFFSGGRAMGFGDAKLSLSVGFLLGAAQGFSAIIIAFWVGAAGSLTYMFLDKYGFLSAGKKLTMKSEIPFAPFIILGAWVSLVFGFDILHVG